MEFGQGFEHRATEGPDLRRCTIGPCRFGLRILVMPSVEGGGQESGDHAHTHERGHAEIGDRPSRPVGDEQGPRPGAHQRQTVAQVRGRRHDALQIGAGGIDAPSVDDDVLGRGADRNEEGAEAEEDEAARRVGRGHEREREGDGDLRRDHPRAPAADACAEDRHVETVDERRPEEFQGVGERQIAEEADRLDVHVRIGEPRRECAEHEQQRQAGREAEGQHQDDAGIFKDIPHGELGARLPRYRCTLSHSWNS